MKGCRGYLSIFHCSPSLPFLCDIDNITEPPNSTLLQPYLTISPALFSSLFTLSYLLSHLLHFHPFSCKQFFYFLSTSVNHPFSNNKELQIKRSNCRL